MGCPMAPLQLIVGGCPDTAAHQVAFVLNEHPRVLLGFERYVNAVSVIDTYHLQPRRVVDPLPQETNVRGETLYARLRARAGDGELAYSGDVVPGYARVLDELSERVPTARFVVALGPPPSGNPAGLEAWRAIARVVRATEQRPYGRRVFMLPWERWVAGAEPWLETLLAFLQLACSPRLVAERTQVTARPQAACMLLPPVLEAADEELEAWRSQRADAQLRPLRGQEPLVDLDDTPLSDEEVCARQAERAELLEQRGRPAGTWPDELGALRRRYRDDTRAIAQRGRRVRERGLTAVSGLPDPRVRVTIVNPHDRAEEITRDAIDRLAAQLARLVSVRLVVRARQLAQLSEAEVVVSERLDVVALTEGADVVICPADQVLVEEVRAAVGDETRLMLLLDDRAGLEVVTTDPLCEVITPAAWLAQAARTAGARVLHIPLGISPSVGAQLTPMAKRGLTVTAHARTGGGHGAEDLQTALVAVREARPEAEIVVFGGVPVDGATQFHLNPPFGSLLGILRASAVHVVASREDAVGAMGALSLAAGSALVTTATDGAAEYAVPGLTALVTPVSNPDALAASVISLLDDLPLRTRIADDGRSSLALLLQSWEEVARRVAVMLVGVR